MGIASIGLRLAIGSLTASVSVPPPSVSKEGVWTAQVLTLGTTDGGKQRAVLLVGTAENDAGDTSGPWRVYAWLPRYPVLIPTDRITFDGRLEPVRLDGSQFAAYLVRSHVDATIRIGLMRVLEAPADPFGIAERTGMLRIRHLRGCSRNRWPGSPPASSWVDGTGSPGMSRTASR